MGAEASWMRYLFGDSSESSLQLNYLAFLRDAVEFAVAALQADAGLAQARERRVVRERAAEEAVRSVEDLGRATLRVVEPFAAGEAPINRCAATIKAAVADAVSRESGRVRGGLASDLEQLDAEMQRLRAKCAAALHALLAVHDLPDAVETLTVTRSGAAHAATLRQQAGFGVDATLTLDIPSSSLFAHDVRVERLGEHIQAHLPEASGWLKKEVKMVPHKLARHHVTQVVVGQAGVIVSVRATLEPGAAGYEIVVADRGDVMIERAGNGSGGEAEGAIEADDRDVAGLRAMAAKLEEAARALRGNRGALIEATIDGAPLAEHDRPRTIVERMVETMAPVVREIARHSLTPQELTLKRLIAGDRREEIFLPRAELTQKLEALPPAQRRVFVPLGIVDEAAVSAAVASHVTLHDHDAAPPRLPSKPPSVPSRPAGKTVPPPVPSRPAARTTEAAVDAALRDLDDGDT